MAAVTGEMTVGALPDSDQTIFEHFYKKSLANFLTVKKCLVEC